MFASSVHAVDEFSTADLDDDRPPFERDWPFDRWIFNSTIATIELVDEKLVDETRIKLSWRMLFRGCSPSSRRDG